MNTNTWSIQRVWEHLFAGDPDAAESLAEAAAELKHSGGSPWYVQTMVAVSAWIAAAMLIAFMFISKLLDFNSSSAAFGLVFITSATVLAYLGRRLMFAGQLALALSLAGLVLFGIGAASIFENNFSLTILSITVLEIILLLVYPSSTRRFISVLLIYSTLETYIYQQIGPWVNSYNSLNNNLYSASQAALVCLTAAAGLYLWEHESKLQTSRLRGLLTPLGFGIPFAFAGLTGLHSFMGDSYFYTAAPFIWLETVGIAGLLVWLELKILKEVGETPGRRMKAPLVLLAATGLLALALNGAPGALGSLLFLALGFRRGRWSLVGLAGIFLVTFFSRYYYMLNFSLLIKSLGLMLGGGILLGARYWIQRTRLSETAVSQPLAVEQQADAAAVETTAPAEEA